MENTINWLRELNRVWPIKDNVDKTPRHYISLVDDKLSITIYLPNDRVQDVGLDMEDFEKDPMEEVEKIKAMLKDAYPELKL